MQPLLGVGKGMFPVRHLDPKILMVFNYCSCKLAQCFGWAAPATSVVGATPHPGVCKHNLQYDGRSDGRIWVWFGMWNLGSLNGKGGEVCDEMRKRMIDVCCLWEVRLRG